MKVKQSTKIRHSQCVNKCDSTDVKRKPQKLVTVVNTVMQQTEKRKQKMRNRKKVRQQIPLVVFPPQHYSGIDEDSIETYKDRGLSTYPMADLQKLFLTATMQHRSPLPLCDWCKILRVGKIRKVGVLVLDDIGIEEVKKYPLSWTNLKINFPKHVELIPPSVDGKSLAEEMFNVPVARKWLMEKTVELMQNNKDKEKLEMGKCDEKCKRTDLLLNIKQMKKEGYPLPGEKEKFVNFKYTKDRYKEVSDDSPLFAVDCEMCLTTNKCLELTWVAVVNEKLEVVYESYVKPHSIILNYITRFSGVTKQILDPVKTRLEDVQEALRNILPSDAILCGQSLHGDLLALQMFHPYCIDTSVIFNLHGIASMKTGLRRLTRHFLGRDIQVGRSGHSPVEDSTATMELVLLKLSEDIGFGDHVLSRHNFASNVEKRPLLYTERDSVVYEDFFSKLEQQTGQSVVLIGPQGFPLSVCQSKTNVSVIETESDMSTLNKYMEHSHNHFVSWAHLSIYTRCLKNGSISEDTEKEILKLLDLNVSKWFASLEEKTIAFVLLPGRTFSGDMTDNENEAACFVQITK